MLTTKTGIFRYNRFTCIKWLLSLFLFATFHLASAQNEAEKGMPFVTNYEPKNISLIGQTWSVMQDNDGIMYFGTINGIIEYDGVRWDRVLFDSIPPLTVRSLTRDNNGTIYYGGTSDFGYLTKDSLGRTKGVSLLKFVPGEYRNFFDIWSSYATPEGVYFQSREYIFFVNNQHWVKVWKPKSKFTYSFYIDGNYFVHQQGLGLYKLVSDSFAFIPGSEFLGKERMQVMLPYTPTGTTGTGVGNKQYFIGMFYGGLYLYDGKAFRPFISEASPLLKNNTLYKGLYTNDGKYILATTGIGLLVLDANGKMIEQVNKKVGIQNESVYSVYLDNNNNLWMGLDNGISRVDISSPFTQFNGPSGINTSLLSMERFDGNIYLGSTNGLLKYNQINGRFETVEGMPNQQIFKLVKDSNQLLITNDGLFALVNNKIKLLRPSVAGDLQLDGLLHSAIHPKVLYTGGINGLKVFLRNGGNWEYYGTVANLSDQIWGFSENTDGSVWTATQSGIVYRFTPSFNEQGDPVLKNFKVEKFGNSQGLVNASGLVFHLGNETFFPGDSCIYRYDEIQKRFVSDYRFGHMPKHGGYDEFFITRDAKGRVFLDFGKRKIIATPLSDGKYQLDTTTLLPLSDHNISYIYPDNNGIVWFCTTDGLIRFDETMGHSFDVSFNTILRHAQAGTEILNTNTGEIDFKEPSISYNNSSIRFDYAAPFYDREDKTQFQTWLEGFEKTWSSWGNNPYKEYTNLPAGNYKFHVRSLNLYKKEGKEAVYKFIVLPPWYGTWWAYLLYVVAAIFLIYLFVNWKVRQLKEKHVELEKIVEERTSQLSQRVEELAVINSVQEALVKEMDMQGIYNMVGDRVQKLFNAQAVIIASFDHENKTERFNYAFEKGEKHTMNLQQSRPINKFRQLLIDQKNTIYIPNQEKAIKEFGLKPIGNTEMPKSLLFVPLLSGNVIKGYVSLQNLDRENAFKESDIRLLETLSNSMSVALENARLFDETNRLLKETEQRTAELGVINSVQEGLVREMNTQSIFTMVGDRICSLFPETQTMVIRTFSQENQIEQWQYAIEKGIKLKNESQPLIWANKQLLVSKKPILINKNYLETARKFGGSGVSKGQPPKSAVFVPMIVGDEVKGSLSLQNVDKENAFTEADVRLLSTVTNSMSVAIENARLFDETTSLLAQAKQRASELSTVNNISKALATKLDVEDLIKMVGDQLKDLFKANIVYLALLDKKTRTIHFPYQFGDNMVPMKLGKGLTSNIIQKGEPLLLNKDVDETTGQLGLQRIGLPAASYLGVPIPVGDEIIGVLSVQSTEQENRFNENDLRLLSTIASSVGVAIKNAQLFEDVQQAKMEAEQASKIAEKANEAKSAFLSTVSHELRTPLTSVLGFAKIIKKRLEEKIFTALDTTDPKTEKTITQISDNLKVVISEGERLTHLINDVLDLAKIEAGKMEWNQENVSMADVIERAIAATTSLFDQKDISLIKEIDKNVPDIIGDTDKLIQVVINLFSNAVKFTDRGSVECRLYQQNDEVIVSIRDTGIGIAKEDFGAVFEQFKQVGGDTLTDKPKGTGLGLPICKEIVEHHGGRIWLESEPGIGSTFSFALPVHRSNIKNQETPIHLNELMKQLKEQMVFSQLKTSGKNATILIVDDDDSIRSLLQQELNEAGYSTEEASDGKKALEAIRKNRPDLIILDVMMPEINGFDVAAILKNDPHTMDIPIIMLSIVQDKTRGFRIGVDRYLTKPIDTVKLFEEVGSLLEQGKSKKKVMVVDEDSSAVRSLTDVLKEKGYIVVESDGKELVENAISSQPDIIILNSVISDKNQIVQSLRFEKGLENVLFLIYQ